MEKSDGRRALVNRRHGQVHAFAAGAMLTLAHDFRVMRADRGYGGTDAEAVAIIDRRGSPRACRRPPLPSVIRPER
jgi:hypothetical protein